ncbi:PREDICTED: cytosolic sulfotransferase 18-like [Camelina sativa]|uniref:Sulfotransferase n=1 Tax=Camelina sativa TaxID=90675 RepID=A0ABM1RS21_CAMSA|nr:PREDICTED: cytosolic sulfotransferase 18-like [Camelina sativa]
MESETTMLPSHKDETKTEFEKNQKRYQDLIATFPHVKGWFSKAPLIEYGGYWFIKPVLEGCLHAQDFFQARPIGILICTYPKSGTTWLKALTFTIANRSRFEDDDSFNPLLKHNPHQLVPFIETDFSLFPKGDALKENTLFSTHMPHDLLPESVAKSGYKIVYIWRDPKDTFISKWAFFEK